MAFNGFLSTRTQKAVSLNSARQASKGEKTVGILFMMTVDPTSPSPPFADIEKHSYYPTEKEVLFPIHTVFRIEDVRQFDGTEHMFQVQLTQTNDADPELRRLTDRIEEDIGNGTGWKQLGRLLLEVSEMNKAEALYMTLLQQKPSEEKQAAYYHFLGLIKDQEDHYNAALQVKTLPANHPDIGAVYYKSEELLTAEAYFQKALDIRKRSLPPKWLERVKKKGRK